MTRPLCLSDKQTCSRSGACCSRDGLDAELGRSCRRTEERLKVHPEANLSYLATASVPWRLLSMALCCLPREE